MQEEMAPLLQGGGTGHAWKLLAEPRCTHQVASRPPWHLATMWRLITMGLHVQGSGEQELLWKVHLVPRRRGHLFFLFCSTYHSFHFFFLPVFLISILPFSSCFLLPSLHSSLPPGAAAGLQRVAEWPEPEPASDPSTALLHFHHIRREEALGTIWVGISGKV